MGGGDVQLGSAGLGIVKVNQIAILGGSFWQQIVNIPSSVVPPKDKPAVCVPAPPAPLGCTIAP